MFKGSLITGDTGDAEEANDADLIVTTPEKWDSVTRRWFDNKELLQSVSLVLIDEVHLLNDPRGSRLEIIVNRMRIMIKKTGGASIRFVVASATIPNHEDLSRWLSDTDGIAARCLTFGEADRPVPLHKHVYSAPFESRNPFTFDLSLNSRLSQIMSEFASGKPTLIFCSTRKSTEATAQFLSVKDNIKIMNGMLVKDDKLQGKFEPRAQIYYSDRLYFSWICISSRWPKYW
jgi:ATP-dependent DNA helicase HFM1/MER3